jgi:hypothetical protein
MTARHLTIVPSSPDPAAAAEPLPHAVADGLPLVEHVIGRLDDVPRLAAVACAVQQTGSFSQLVLDASADGGVTPALADLAVPVAVRRLVMPACVGAHRVGELLEAVDAALRDADPVAVMVHGDDDAALAGALAAARRALPLVRVHPAAEPAPPAVEAVQRVADLLLVPDDSSASALARRGIAPERVVVVGDPLPDAVRLAARAAAARKPPAGGRVRPGRYVFAVLAGPSAPPETARALRALERREPLVVELSPALAAAWDAAGVLAPLAAVSAAGGGGFARRVSLVRSAGAVITDSDTTREIAELLGVECHAPAQAGGLRLPPLPGARRPVSYLVREGRAAERVAATMVANFAGLPL